MSAVELVLLGRRWRADLTAPCDLAIELDFAGAQPSFFARDPARAEPLQVGSFTGSVATGASCNCAVYTLAPHCHGTHTECVGHVTRDAVHVSSVTPVAPTLALLVTVTPVAPAATPPAFADHSAPGDRCVSRAALAAAAERWLDAPWSALILRTAPNAHDKRHRSYNDGPAPAPYLLPETMAWIVERDVTSLVVDLPSLDRADDGGRLAAHRTYWGLPPGSVDARAATRGTALVTELAFIPDEVADGLYLLDLQVPAFATDAAPSRPVIYRVTEMRP